MPHSCDSVPITSGRCTPALWRHLSPAQAQRGWNDQQHLPNSPEIFPAARWNLYGATMHIPSNVTKEAVSILLSKNADSLVSIGVGSTVGLDKAISIRTRLPHICIPTTYAGSEMTLILSETSKGKKTTRSAAKILPSVITYSVELIISLHPLLFAPSGVIAIAHAAGALYATNINPIITLLAPEAKRALADSLTQIIEDSYARPAREKHLIWSLEYRAWNMELGI
jgi:alcohol dehydrogenase class IV